MIVPDLTRPLSILEQVQSPASDNAKSLQTFGPTLNEAERVYERNGAAHHLVSVARISTDVLLGHGARVSAFYRRLGETPVLDTASRPARDQVLRAELPIRVPVPGEVVIVSPLSASEAVPEAVAAQVGGFGISGFGVSQFGIGG